MLNYYGEQSYRRKSKYSWESATDPITMDAYVRNRLLSKPTHPSSLSGFTPLTVVIVIIKMGAENLSRKNIRIQDE